MPDQPIADDAEDSDLSSIASLSAFDESSYRKLLAEQGVSEALMDALVAPIKAQAQANARLAARDQARGLKEYRTGLLAELKLPDATPLTGTTKAELRRSAQAQRAFADSIAATLAPATRTSANAATAAAGADLGAAAAARRANEEAFLSPPGGATEVIADRVQPAWGDQRTKALGGSRRAAEARPSAQSKEEVLADIMANGVPRVPRPSMQTILARGGEKGA